MLITLLLLCAVLSVAGGQRALVGVVLVAPAVIGEWLNYWQPELLIYVVTRGVGLLFIGFVVVQLLRFIVYAPRVDSEVLCAAMPVTCYRGSPGLLLMPYWAAWTPILLFLPSARSPANR